MPDSTLKNITMRPGVVKDLTKYEAEGSWVDCDKIRFRASRPEKIGGWVRETVSQSYSSSNVLFTGVPRASLSWNSLDSKKYLAVASHQKLEIMYGNQIFDVTPVRTHVSDTDILSTLFGSTEVTLKKNAHGTVVGDFIDVTTPNTIVDGVVLSGRYQVTDIVNADNFKVDSGFHANNTTLLSGGAIVFDILLENGPASNGSITGWSGGSWGTPGEGGLGWNEPRAGTGGLNLRQWSLDTWGEDLLACNRQGKIYHWVEDNAVTTRAVVLTNAPVSNLFILVSQPTRHLIAFGSEVFAGSTFDPLIIRWASQETLDEWDITLDNTAGEYRLPSGNYIVGAVQTRSEILVFTDTDVYAMRYVGGNDIFTFEPLGTNTSVISQHAGLDVNGVVYWMGVDKFYMYDGVIHILPTTIDKYLFSQDGEGIINLNQKEKCFAGINKQFNEIWWFYPALSEDENDHYVKYNYFEQTWDFGTLNRTVWVDRSIFSHPYALDETGKLYVHEQGKDADSQPLEAFITTAFFDIDDGQDFMFVNRLIPDVKLAASRNIEITVFTKRYPHPGSEVTTKGPYFFDDTGTQISLRSRGRQMAVEFRVVSTGSSFEIGKIRIGYQPDGERG